MTHLVERLGNENTTNVTSRLPSLDSFSGGCTVKAKAGE
jgi:hypothetical protein